VRGFCELAYLALPTANKNGPATGAGSGHQVSDSISDHVALVQRHLQVRRRIFQHPYFRLSAIAALPQFANFRFRMMQAVIHVVNATAGGSNLLKHCTLEGQTHMVKAEALGPTLVEFFQG